ncbi:MAG TPA: GNAT family N-acyltransferase [Alphaproteobacteria bacterium]|nr:GNAT family N-acyltransferase [Alphaproteobacteria bacterium]
MANIVSSALELPREKPATQPPPLLAVSGPHNSLGTNGALEVRLTTCDAELKACQRLRYDVFFEEMMARPSPEEAAERRDFDEYDDICDHLVVIDHAGEGGVRLVGTYRLLLKARAGGSPGFYTAGEYDLSPLISGEHAHLNFLELGRSCVHANYRTKPVIDLLWRGIGAYVTANDVDVMFGCGSFLGRDPDAHAEALTYLYRHHLAPEDWRAKALPSHYTAMDRMPGREVDPKKGFRGLPPIIRGYIRAGAYVGDGAFIDDEFGTVDVLIIFPVEQVKERYFARFGLYPDGRPGQDPEA